MKQLIPIIVGGLGFASAIVWVIIDVIRGQRKVKRSLERLGDAIERVRTPIARSFPSYIVVWGQTLYDGKARETVCSLPFYPVSPGVTQSIQLCPQSNFQLQRWLIIGAGRMRAVMIGQNIQTPDMHSIAGVSGKSGDGTFDRCDIGCRITFEVDSDSER